jgi:hypothetical protein
MRNRIWLAIVFSLLSPALFAVNFDGGGTISNSTDVEVVQSGEDPGIDQLAALTLWFELNGAKENGNIFSFAGQGRYEITDDRYYLFDVDYLRFFMRFPGGVGESSVFEFQAGRFFFSEPSRMILSHNADGLAANFRYPKVNISLSGGYTGLLLNPKSDIRISVADWSDEGNEEAFYFGPKHAFAMLGFTFQGVKKPRSSSLILAAQFDLRPDKDEGRYHTQYFGIQASPRIGKNFYMDFLFIFQTGEIYQTDEDPRFVMGTLLGFSFKILRETWLNSNISFRLLAAPPDFSLGLLNGVDFDICGYIPISQPELGVTVTPQLSGLGLLELAYSFRPFSGSHSGMASRFQIGIAGRSYLRTSNLRVNWIETEPDSDSVYLGTEIEANAAWRMFSDVGLGFVGAVFIPGGAALNKDDVFWSMGLDLSVSF